MVDDYENRATRGKTGERGLKLKQLCYLLLLQWRAVLAVAFVCGVLVCGLKYVKDSRNVQSAPSTDAAAANLDDIEKKAVSDAADDASEVASLQEYIKESPLMQGDLYSKNTLVLQYVIGGAAPGSMNTLVRLYESYIDSSEMTSLLASDLLQEGNEKYISELVKVSSDASLMTNADATTDSDSSMGYLCVSIALPDDADASKVEDTLTNGLADYAEKLRGKGYANTLALADSDVSAVPRVDLVTAKIDYENRLTNMRNSLAKDIEAFSSAQKQALLAECEDRGIDTESLLSTGLITEEYKKAEVASKSPAKPRLSKKWFVLGVAAGIVAYAVAIILYAAISGQMMFAEDLEEIYGLRVYGEFRKFEPRSKFAKAFLSKCVYEAHNRKHLDISTQAEKCSIAIEKVMKRKGIDAVDVVPVGKLSEEALAIIDLVAKALAADGKRLNVAGDVQGVSQNWLLAVDGSADKFRDVEDALLDSDDSESAILGSLFLQVG